MIFSVSFSYDNERRDEVFERFRQTGGAPPPDDVRLVGRWHNIDGNGGILVAEADTTNAMAEWIQQWSDLISFDIKAVLDDADFAAMIG